MQNWHTTYLGLKDLPRELSTFELQAFFTYSKAEREVIDARYGAPHKLGLALHMGFRRLSGRSLNALGVVPVSLWAHLGKELGVRPPEIASLKAMYACGKTFYDHRQLAQQTLGFRLPTEHQSRAFVQALRDEASRSPDKDQMLVFTRRWLYDHKFLIESKRAFNTQITTALDLFETQTGDSLRLPGAATNGAITLQLRSQNETTLSPLMCLCPLKPMLSPPFLATVVVPSP